MSGSAVLNLIAAIASAVSGLGAAIAAAIMIRLQRRWSSADTLLRVSEVFESVAFRKYKTIIYRLDRNSFSSWNEDEVASVNAWCAHLDIVSS
ncbi:hypothetical protein [Nonomuraea turcica]|uniref:hypothetical protein n=1 Tax=Nonomuraea sp. G32 TaxID=3067274 RepID=UPI00273C1C04|nr:hypothetical protein [Nonomuraea sp. G32]MDP4506730.1 hypothetical protein [Nonomuraea sp. G32]